MTDVKVVEVGSATIIEGQNIRKDKGSLIIILVRDGQLMPHQRKRMAKTATLGMARTGSLGASFGLALVKIVIGLSFW